MYIIELVDRQSLNKIKGVEIVNEPTLNEEINAAYTFEFEAHYKAKSDFHRNVLVKVEGQYFQIVRVVKSRQNSINLSVHCEHVSYELIDAEDVTEEYEDTAQGMLASILSGTRFNVGECMWTDFQYYKPSTKEVRQRLIDIAHLFGGELIFDDFTVSLVPQRGSNKGLKVELGVNLLGVTEEIDYVEGTTAYEIDLVDLAEVAGYELDFSSADIGDTIQIVDSELGINTSERILSIQRNPFQPQLPTLTVGDYIRDFTEYLKEEKEEKDKEEDKGLLAQFKVGKIDCLALKDNIDAKSAVLDYLKDTSLQGVIPSTDVELTESQTGVIASLKPDFSSYKLTAIITTETESGLDTDFYELPNTAISSLVLPQQNVSVSVTLAVTKVPFADLVDGKVPIVEDGENATFLEAYGVRFLINDGADGFLEDFKVGNVDVLSFDDIECTAEVLAYIKGQKPNPHALWEYETEKLKGIYASLKELYKNHHLTFIHTKVAAGNTTTEVRKMPFANGRIMEIPTAKDDSVIMVITKEPFESLTATNVDASFIKAFGVRFEAVEKPWLDEFKIGDEDCVNLPGLDITAYAGEGEPKGAVLELSEKVDAITIKVNADYKNYFKQVIIWESNEPITIGAPTPNTHFYNESDFDNAGKLMIKAPFPNAKNGRIAIIISEENPTGNQAPVNFKSYMIDVTKNSSGETDDYWLSEFRIGDVDCLELPEIQIPPSEETLIVTAEIEYAELQEHLGLFVTPKEEYADYYLYAQLPFLEPIDLKTDDTSSLRFPINSKDIVIIIISKVDIMTTQPTEGEYQAFGVKFVKKGPEPIETNGVRYAYIGEGYERIGGLRCVSLSFITNITNFREDYIEGKYFETDSETTELYPVAYGLYFEEGNLVQVVDGVVTSILSNNDRA